MANSSSGKWWENATVYQIYPKSFFDSNGDGIGDIEGVRRKLGYIKSLGVDIIWLCPYLKSPQADNGYDVSDYYEIDPIFGNKEDLRKLIDECHATGLRFVMDMVTNHSSDEHEWFKKARAGDEKYMDYYYFKDPVDGREPNNWESIFGGSAWEYVPSLNKYYLHLFHRKQPDLNWTNPEVVDNVVRVMKYWGEFGVDGFRLDAINYLYKDPAFPSVETRPGQKYGFGGQYYSSKPQVNEYFARLNRDVFTPFDMMTVAEVGDMDPERAREYCGKYQPEIDMVYMYDMLNFDQEGYDKFKPVPFEVKKFKETIFRWQDEFRDVGRMALFLSNHDQTRNVGRFGDDSPRYRYRSSQAQALAMYMLKGTPYIYQGEELAMSFLDYEKIEDFNDIEVEFTYGEKVVKGGEPFEKWLRLYNTRSRDIGRSPMQWDDSENAGFSTGKPWQKVNGEYVKVNVAAEDKDPASTLNFYRKLLPLRKTLKSVQYGSVTPFDYDSESTFCYVREYEDEVTVCRSNLTARRTRTPLPEGEYEILLSNTGRSGRLSGSIELMPYEALLAIRK
jgi:oligo-1,6-glucosidase